MLGRSKPVLKRTDAVVAVGIIQRGHCAYHSPRCDCKFGVVQLGRTQGSEHGSGCPELREIELVLAGLTNRQYAEAYRLGSKRAVRVLRGVEQRVRDKRDPAQIQIYAVHWSVRTANVLHNLGARTLADLSAYSASDLLLVKNCGRKTVQEIRRMLARHGARLYGEVVR